jgi:hypothetical protein
MGSWGISIANTQTKEGAENQRWYEERSCFVKKDAEVKIHSFDCYQSVTR